VFETLRSYDGVVFRLERHLDRLHRSLLTIGIDWPIVTEEIRSSMSRLLEANGVADARIRLTVTGGLFDGTIRLARTHPPTCLIMATPLVPPGDEAYARGITLWESSYRQAWSSLLARVKTIHRLEYLMAREEAIRNGADDALLLDDRGQVAECSASNLFLVSGDRVVTPSLEGPILAGVTRETALQAAALAGFETVERLVLPGELETADELFVTNTSTEIMAVREVNGHSVGHGGRGPATARIHESFRRLVRSETELSARGRVG
jgi:branched-chain amino acid aminotransferase